MREASIETLRDELAVAADTAVQRPVLIQSPGRQTIRAALAPWVREAARQRQVTIIASANESLMRWVDWLSDYEDVSLHKLNAATALESLDEHLDSARVTLATFAALRRQAVKEGLAASHRDVVIVDTLPLPGGQAYQLVAELTAGARYAVAISDSQAPESLPGAETIVVPAQKLYPGHRHDVVVKPINVLQSTAERQILAEAAPLLAGDADVSRSAAHAKLLVAAAQITDGDFGRTDAIWGLIDRIEALTADERLSAFTDLVAQYADRGPVVVLTGPLRAEAEYVRSYLESAGIAVVAQGRAELRLGRVTEEIPDHVRPVIISSWQSIEPDEVWLRDSTVIFWSQPAIRQAPLISLLSDIGAVREIIHLVDTPG
ncbi:hypothetical protein [Actinoplanes friuliensis]|uniref:Uncharacterized protein n=1 Tax=Actinoplanes friuliensis DSM 7358 TaxID=1246995 RepID=U5W4Z0_9ACTN|nr:hypothetical protein [Actinoplanes friuliensis]AGZ44199.1 hypothetical protein AFR_29690 [Actinoplanes friuliensis DSM 7358]